MRIAPGVASSLVIAVAAAGCSSDFTLSSGAATEEAPTTNGGRQPAPIVLMHGMAGFEAIGPAEYFYGVREALEAGGYPVLVTVVDPFNSVEARAEQAKEQIEAYLAETGATRVHLLGHSQGGLDARHLVSVLGLGDRVATVTTISTPHRGIELIDVSTGLVPGDAIAAMAAISSAFLGVATGTQADLGAQVGQLGRQYAHDVFNPSHPDDARVEYFSVAGETQPWLFVNVTNTDICDPLMLPAYWMNRALEGDNDGLVPVESAKWGTFLGTIPADHLDEMGWFPEVPQPAFDHVTFYRSLAAYLSGEGPAPLTP